MSTRATLLATAQLSICNQGGCKTRLRALLDQDSEISFIKESIVTFLYLLRRQVVFSGIRASKAGKTRGIMEVTLHSLHEPTFSLEVSADIFPRLSTRLSTAPSIKIPWECMQPGNFVDPDFTQPGSVDMILGADVYGQLLKTGIRSFPN